MLFTIIQCVRIFGNIDDEVIAAILESIPVNTSDTVGNRHACQVAAFPESTFTNTYDTVWNDNAL